MKVCQTAVQFSLRKSSLIIIFCESSVYLIFNEKYVKQSIQYFYSNFKIDKIWTICYFELFLKI